MSKILGRIILVIHTRKIGGVETMFSLISIIVSIVALVLSLLAFRRARLATLFSTFDEVSKATIQYPELLYSVHQLNKKESEEEARSLAYLSMLLDAYQHFYSPFNIREEVKDLWESCLSKRAPYGKLTGEKTFLNNILAVQKNQERWQEIKKLYYNDFDKSFIETVEKLIEEEKRSD